MIINMKIEFKNKAKIIPVIAVFIIALVAGLALEHMRNDKFTVETIASTEAETPIADAEPTLSPETGDETENTYTEVIPENVTEAVRYEAEQKSEGGISAEGKININTADEKTLMQINGIGETLSKRIIEYRTQHGPFEAIEEITNVSGIGAKKLENMRDMICVE